MPKKESFKQSMDRLDEIIAQLNQNEVELEEAITLFEEGLKLVKQCDAQLKQFEKRVSVLSEVKEEGEGDA
ncbi:MAG TPA: exodeoxyribonuclease VII small subunit [Candidatus Merdibacter merdavium]|uniref:Exodeoxyribonuclease 7 small subunit n=1 Tax=Candidatus Merdibacter merdavium TaxID=2838692 RepID=A0A9D2SWK1_9FIRM|nr:exodeoxyribonuclease VII small subunit [Candidatus Merdibacter merdavium]